MQNFKSYSEDPENINLGQVWKTLNKLWPKFGISVPSAKKDHKGKLVLAPSKLKKLLAKVYKGRLRTRPVRPDLGSLEKRRSRILKMKLKLAKSRSSSPWSMAELERALMDLNSTNPEILKDSLMHCLK